MSQIDTIGFFIFGAFALWFFGMNLYEFYGVRNFIERVFFSGLRLISFNEQWGDLKFQGDIDSKNTSSGKFKVINDSMAFFRYNQPLISFRVYTPLPLKGVIELKDGKAFVSGRAPLAPLVFMLIWLIGWTACGVSIFFFSNENRLISLGLILGGYIFFGAVVAISYYIERRRFIAVLSEFKLAMSINTQIESKKHP